MAYKKPKMVAKSVAKKAYVAGCPSQTGRGGVMCDHYNTACEIGPAKQ